MHYIYLSMAILFEIVGTTAMAKSEQFSKLIPSSITVVCYAAAFYCLSFALKQIPVGVAYAIWSGVGVAVITLIGVVIFKQKLDIAGVAGIILIVAGVIVLNLFSKTNVH